MIVSSNADDLAVMLALACLTESRTDAEQRALLRVAERLDKASNNHVLSNPRFAAWQRGEIAEWFETHYEHQAHASRVLDSDEGEHHVKPSWEKDAKKAAKRKATHDAEIANMEAHAATTDQRQFVLPSRPAGGAAVPVDFTKAETASVRNVVDTGGRL